MAMETTAMPTLHPVTCSTSFSRKTPVQPPQGPWARGPTAVGLQPAGLLRAEHQLVGPLAVSQVCAHLSVL